MKKMQHLLALFVILAGTVLPSLMVVSEMAYGIEIDASEKSQTENAAPILPAEFPVLTDQEQLDSEDTEGDDTAEPIKEPEQAEEVPAPESLPETEIQPELKNKKTSITIIYDEDGSEATVAGYWDDYYVNLNLEGIPVEEPTMTLLMPKAIFEKPERTDFPEVLPTSVRSDYTFEEDEVNYKVNIPYKSLNGGDSIGIPFRFSVKRNVVKDQEKVEIQLLLWNQEQREIMRDVAQFTVGTTIGYVKENQDLANRKETVGGNQVVAKDDGKYVAEEYLTEWGWAYEVGTDKRSTRVRMYLNADDIFIPDLRTGGAGSSTLNVGWTQVEDGEGRYIERKVAGGQSGSDTVWLYNPNMKIGQKQVREVWSTIEEDDGSFNFGSSSVSYVDIGITFSEYQVEKSVSKSVKSAIDNYDYSFENMEKEEWTSSISAGILDERSWEVPLGAAITINGIGDEFYEGKKRAKKSSQLLTKYRLTVVTDFTSDQGTFEIPFSSGLTEEEAKKIQKNKLIGFSLSGEQEVIAEDVPINLNRVNVLNFGTKIESAGDFIALENPKEYQRIELHFNDVTIKRTTGVERKLVFAVQLDLVTKASELIKDNMKNYFTDENYQNGGGNPLFYSIGDVGYNLVGDERAKNRESEFPISYWLKSAYYTNTKNNFSSGIKFWNSKDTETVTSVGTGGDLVVSDERSGENANIRGNTEKGTYMFLFSDSLEFTGFKQQKDYGVTYTTKPKIVYNYQAGKTAVFVDVELDNNNVSYPGSSYQSFDFRPMFRVSRSAKASVARFESYLIWENNQMSLTEGIIPKDGVKDIYDIDKDGNYDELCLYQDAGISIKPIYEFGITSKVGHSEESDESLAAGVLVDAGDKIKMNINLNNQGENEVSALTVLDVLPRVGDTTFLENINSQQTGDKDRGSTFDALLQGPLRGKNGSATPAGYSIYYSLATPQDTIQGNVEADIWLTEDEITDYTKVTMLKIVMDPGTILAKYEEVDFVFDVQKPQDEDLIGDHQLVNTIASYRNGSVSESEFSKVLIAKYQISGTVYIDKNGNGVQDIVAGDPEKNEPGLNGYMVELFTAGGDSIAKTTTKTKENSQPVARMSETESEENGYYVFQDVEGLEKEGLYQIQVTSEDGSVVTISNAVGSSTVQFDEDGFSDNLTLTTMDSVRKKVDAGLRLNSRTVTVKYVDQDGKSILQDKDGKTVESKELIIFEKETRQLSHPAVEECPNIADYDFVGDEKSLSITYADAGETVVLKYAKQKQGTITVQHRHGKEVGEPVSERKKVGTEIKNGEINPKVDEVSLVKALVIEDGAGGMWTLTKGSDGEFNLIDDKNEQIAKGNAAVSSALQDLGLGIDVSAKDWQVSGQYVDKKITLTYDYGETSIQVMHKQGSQEPVKGLFAKGYYDAKIEGVKPNAGKVSGMTFMYQVDGKDYQLTLNSLVAYTGTLKDELAALGITGISNSWEISGEHKTQNLRVTYLYSSDDGSNTTPIPESQVKHVYVKYVDENGKEIAISTVLTGQAGEPYQASGKTIAGYELVGLAADSEAEAGVFGDGLKTVIYQYKKKVGIPEIPTDPTNPTNPNDPTNPTNPENPSIVTPLPTPIPESNGNDKADGNGEKNESGAGNAKITGNVKTKDKNDLPKTGEANRVVLWFIGVVCIALVLVFFQKSRGKNATK